MSTTFVVVKDANGDRVATIGPFATEVDAREYTLVRQSRRGEWFLETVTPHVTPEALDWESGSDVYQALRRIGR